MATGKELGPGGRAHRADEEALEGSPILGQGIEIRRGKVGVPIHAQVPPALVVREEDHDVGLSPQTARNKEQENGKKKPHGLQSRVLITA